MLKFNYLRTLILVCVILLSASGCASYVSVNVNSITDISAKSSGNHYVLVNHNEDADSSNLYFLEFSRYFDHVLTKQGYAKVDDPANADIKIIFQFGISDGRTGLQTYSWPIYETFGGQTYTITEKSTNNSGQTVTTQRTVYIPAQVRQVGSTYETRSYTIYNRYANLTALPTSANGQTTPLWNINIHSVGENSDLRAIMPYLAAAASPYIAKNSGQQKTLELTADNPLVKELKSLITTTPDIR